MVIGKADADKSALLRSILGTINLKNGNLYIGIKIYPYHIHVKLHLYKR